jgi:oxygen-dependent protoporphyrinogen oxidase
MKKVVILGAGIAGLAAAWFIQKRCFSHIKVSIMERSERVGGCIRTVNDKGFLFEEGPRGFRPSGKGKATLELVRELNLENELVSANSLARKRYLYLDGKLQAFNAWFLLKQGLLTAAFRDLFTPPLAAEDETIAAFFERRFNKKLSDNVIDPLTKGIFGGDSHKLSVRSCLPFLWNLEKESGSVIKGFLKRERKEKNPTALYTFKKGMETLPLALANRLEGFLIFSKKVNSLNEIDADILISSLPASELAMLLGCEDPLEYATLSTVNCGWNHRVLNRSGYGFLIPSKEHSDIMGMTWDSGIFPQLNQAHQTRICIMVAGEHTQDTLRKRALESLKHYLGITKTPDVCRPYVARNAIPQYTLGYFQRLSNLKKNMFKKVHILGQSFEGLGINECIWNAKRLVETLCQETM